MSSKTDEEATCTAKNCQFEIEFKADYDAYSKRVQTFENNETKAYAQTWERCANTMKNKIKPRSDYDKIKNNLIEQLKAIKEHALNYQEKRYAMSIILDAMRMIMNNEQKEGESLQDYTKQFCVARVVLKSHVGGPIILTKIVEAMPTFDKANEEELEKLQGQVYNQFLVYLYLDNADKSKFGSILTGLNTQQSCNTPFVPLV